MAISLLIQFSREELNEKLSQVKWVKLKCADIRELYKKTVSIIPIKSKEKYVGFFKKYSISFYINIFKKTLVCEMPY